MALIPTSVTVRVPAVTRLRFALGRMLVALGWSPITLMGRLRYDVRIGNGRWRKCYSEAHVEVVNHGGIDH